jgi:hypothetical protein
MKKVFLFLFTAALFSSCSEDTSSDVSRVTNYPLITLLGDDVVYVHKGDPFTDPGVIVTEGGVEIPYTTTVTGQFRGGSTLDTDVEDIYTITYAATNQDGFMGSATRTVIVADTGDLVTNIAGLYRSTVTRNGTLTAQYTDLEYVLIWKNDDGTYQMSDGIGGYYSIGRAYGNAYNATPMVITANNIPANDFDVSDYEVGTFGDPVHNTAFTVNAANQTINFTSVWSTSTVYTFNVLLEQAQF